MIDTVRSAVEKSHIGKSAFYGLTGKPNNQTSALIETLRPDEPVESIMLWVEVPEDEDEAKSFSRMLGNGILALTNTRIIEVKGGKLVGKPRVRSVSLGDLAAITTQTYTRSLGIQRYHWVGVRTRSGLEARWQFQTKEKHRDTFFFALQDAVGAAEDHEPALDGWISLRR